VNTVRRILANADITVITQSHDSFLKALDRYSSRTDKQYSLTDCSSMNAMAAVWNHRSPHQRPSF
jgi:hypothetical protein